MTMGLHADDVAFFLAADEPATYLQVLRLPPSPIANNQVPTCSLTRLLLVWHLT